MRFTSQLVMCAVVCFAGSKYVRAEPIETWRPIFVPAERQDLWPSGNWVPIDATLVEPELQSALNLPAPPTGYLAAATYDASLELSDQSADIDQATKAQPQLRGTFAWKIERPSTSPALIPLGRPDIAMFDLLNGNDEAVWGLSDDGVSSVAASKGSSKVTGRWAISGTLLDDGMGLDDAMGFQFTLPPSLSTSVRITVPKNFRVNSEQAIVLQEQSNLDASTRIWDIRPARGFPVRFKIVPRRRPRELTSRLYKRVLDVRVTESTIDWRADLELYFAGRRPTSTTIRVPSKARLDKVFVNSSLVATAQPVVVGGQSLLQIPLPTTGEVRVRLAGQTPRSGRRFIAPTVDVTAASILDGQLKALVVPPLHIESVEASGYRQVVGALDNGSGDQLEFVQTAPQGSVSFRVAPPQPKLVASELTLLDQSIGVPNRKTFIELTATTGTAFAVELDWPIEWSVTDVRHGDNSPVESWSVASNGPDKRRISVSLRRPVAPNRSERILVSGRLSSPTIGSVESIRPVIVQSAEMKPRVVGTPLTLPNPRATGSQSSSFSGEGRAAETQSLRLLSREAIRETTSLADIAESLFDKMQFYSPQKTGLRPTPILENSEGSGDAIAARSANVVPRPTLQLSLVWPDGQSQYVQATATYQYRQIHEGPLPSVHLPDGAKWIVARSQDGPIAAVHRDGLWRFGPDSYSREVTIEYTLPIQSLGLSQHAELGCPTLLFEKHSHLANSIPTVIELSLPNGFELVDLKCPLQLSHNRYRVSFWSRVFGPLARPIEAVRFRPWSSSDWIRMLWSNQPPDTGGQPRNVLSFLSPTALPTFSLEIITPSVTIALSWLNWWIGLGVICVARSYRLTNWRLFIVCFMGAVCGVSLLVPDEIAILTGGLVCGMGFGMLIPRYYLRLPKQNTNPDADTSVIIPSLALFGVLGLQMVSTDLAVAESDVTPTSHDILIPTPADSRIDQEIVGTVYVSPLQAERFRARAASRGHLIRRSDFTVGLEGTQIRVSTRVEVVRFQSSSGVRIPLSGNVTLDSETVTVNDIPVTPVPLADAVFIPVGASETNEIDIRFDYVIPGNITKAGQTTATFGAVAGTNNVLRTRGQITLDGTQIRSMEENDSFRLQNWDTITLRSAPSFSNSRAEQNGPDTVLVQEDQSTSPDLIAEGQIAIIESPLSDNFDFTIAFRGLATIENAVIELPPSWKFLEPAIITREKPATETASQLTRHELKLWSRSQSVNGTDRTKIQLANEQLANSLTIRGRGWIVPSRNSRSEETPADARLPKLVVNGEEVACSWNTPSLSTAASATDTELKLGTLGQENPEDQADRNDTNGSVVRAVSVEQTGALGDDEIRWRASAELDLGNSPLFGLTIGIPANATAIRVEAESDGKIRPPRVSRNRNTLDLLFNGAVSDDLSLSVFLSMPRPPRGRKPLPVIRFPDFSNPPDSSSMTFVNESSNPTTLLTPVGDQVTMWQSAQTFPNWPASGPRQMVLSDKLVEAEIDYVVTVEPNAPPRLQISLASADGPTRRSIAIPAVESLDESQEATVSKFVTLTTLPDQLRQTVSVTNFAPSSDAQLTSQHPTVFAAPQRFDRTSLWVITSTEYDRVPRASEAIAIGSLPEWLRALLPDTFAGTVYRVDGMSLQMAERPVEIGLATVADVEHNIWASVDRKVVHGISKWQFSDSGLIQITKPSKTSVRSVLIDRVDSDDFVSNESISVTSSCVIYWSSEVEDQAFLPPSILDQIATEEHFILHCNDVRLHGSGISETQDDASGRTLSSNTDTTASPSNILSVAFPFASWPASNTRLTKNVPVQSFVRSDPNAVGQSVSLESVRTNRWFTGVFVFLSVATIVLVAFRLDAKRVWKRIADSIAESPRAIVALFGFGWWLFLTPSALGFAIMLVIAGLTLFRPLQNKRQYRRPVSAGTSQR